MKNRLTEAGLCGVINQRELRRAERIYIFKNDFPSLVEEIRQGIFLRIKDREARKEEALQLLSGLSALHPLPAEVITRHFVRGETMESIADSMAYSSGQVYRFQREGLKLLTGDQA